MLKPKTKGLFIEYSEFSVLAARTSGYKLPMVVEELAEFDLKDGPNPEDLRAFLEGLVDFKKAAYFVSRCGVYPDGRYVRLHEAESPQKLKDPEALAEKLKEEYEIVSETHNVAILDPSNGADFDFEKSKSKRVLLCGAKRKAFDEAQDTLLEGGIFPERMELSSITTLGGLVDYSRFSDINVPILFLELTANQSNISVLNGGAIDVARPVPFGLDSIYPLLQAELGLKDAESARKLFFSNTFDFAEMGPKLLRRILKELQATAGLYEVETGQTIGYVFLSVLPRNLSWIAKTVSDVLGLEILQPSLGGWLESLQIEIGDGVELLNRGNRWLGLFSLMGEFHLREEVESD